MTGLVGQLAARRPQVAIPGRLPMDWAFPVIGLVTQLAAYCKLPPLGLYRWISNLMAIEWQLRQKQTHSLTSICPNQIKTNCELPRHRSLQVFSDGLLCSYIIFESSHCRSRYFFTEVLVSEYSPTWRFSPNKALPQWFSLTRAKESVAKR